jgi:hypothetical protein
MEQINALELTATIVEPRKLVTLQHNGDLAINSQISFSFGTKNCQMVTTAYNDVAEKISRLPSGSEVIILGAIYQEKYKDKTTGQMKTVDKIRINSFQEDDTNFDDINPFSIF